MTTREKYTITVSEPWNYTNTAGDNVIEGRILKIISKACIVFISDSLTNISGVRDDIFVLSSRYKEPGETGDLEGITVNGGLFTGAFTESLTEHELKQSCEFVIMGQLKKVKDVYGK